ncbi:MAG: FapA family protein [Treponema sp.]|jgi:uncharacterized protein (DUF342 family)|nr:FapA family protein [Treponema sp.]
MKNNEKVDRFTLLPGNKNDGNVSVFFTDDKLELWADFYPSGSGGTPLTAEAVAAGLAQFRIVYGILGDVIEKSVAACNSRRQVLRDVVIARGDPPVDERLEYYQFNPQLKPQGPAPLDPEGGGYGGRVDYRSFSPFIIVKKGQALAKRKSRRVGRNGRDIYGAEIPFSSIRPDGVSGGANTINENGFIYAGINGQLVVVKGVLNVQDTLVIKGSVDYRTGHIIFPGDVFINGPVSDGFKIYSGGSVTIKQTFDVTDVITKANLTVAGGIIGRGRALVKVGGKLTTKFIENCKAACRKTIQVEGDIVNSSVYTMENVEMGEKGRILGGEIYALKGITAGGIGKRSGKSTRIHCGVDFTAQQEKEKLTYHLRIISAKLGKLRELSAAEAAENPEPAPESPGAERRKKMEEARIRLEEEQKKTGEQITAAMGKINAYEDAAVEVLGEIASGTLIEICQAAFFVTEPLRRVRIHLDRNLGRLVQEPLP